MKITTYKCDVCGAIFSEEQKSEYISHLKEHAKVNMYMKDSKEFCKHNKQKIIDLFSNKSKDEIEYTLYNNYHLISEYIMKKYFLTNISSYSKYLIFKDIFDKITTSTLNYQTLSENDNDEAYFISFKTELGHIEVKHIYETNFGNGISIKIIDKGSYGIKITLTLKKHNHRI